MIDVTRIRPRRGQPRKVFDQKKIQELAASIAEHGVLQPILVRPDGDGFQLIAGERRYRASLLAGLTRLPAMVQALPDRETAMASLIENIQREELNPIEEAEAVASLLQQYGLTHDELAERLGMSRPAVTNRLRLLNLPEDVKALIANREISPGHAKMLAGLPDPNLVRRWVARIHREGLSVAATERLITRAKKAARPAHGANREHEMNNDVHQRHVENSLREILGAKVRIRHGRQRGTIEIEYYSLDELQRIVDTLLQRDG